MENTVIYLAAGLRESTGSESDVRVSYVRISYVVAAALLRLNGGRINVPGANGVGCGAGEARIRICAGLVLCNFNVGNIALS